MCWPAQRGSTGFAICFFGQGCDLTPRLHPRIFLSPGRGRAGGTRAMATSPTLREKKPGLRRTNREALRKINAMALVHTLRQPDNWWRCGRARGTVGADSTDSRSRRPHRHWSFGTLPPRPEDRCTACGTTGFVCGGADACPIGLRGCSCWFRRSLSWRSRSWSSLTLSYADPTVRSSSLPSFLSTRGRPEDCNPHRDKGSTDQIGRVNAVGGRD